MLDTNICIHVMNGRRKDVVSRLEAMAEHELSVSVITACELAFGTRKSGSARNEEALKKFLLPLTVFGFTDDAIWHYARLRDDLQRAGHPIGPMDTLIAAHALALDAILVTNNRKEFDRVSGLRVENWASA